MNSYVLVAGHSKINAGSETFKVPPRLRVFYVAHCGYLASSLINKNLTERYLGTTNGIRSMFKGSRVFEQGGKMHDVQVRMTAKNANDTLFHGVLTLPLGPGENISRNNSIRRREPFHKVMQLSTLLQSLSDSVPEGRRMYVVLNFCRGVEGLKIGSNRLLLRGRTFHFRPGETPRNLLSRRRRNKEGTVETYLKASGRNMKSGLRSKLKIIQKAQKIVNRNSLRVQNNTMNIFKRNPNLARRVLERLKLNTSKAEILLPRLAREYPHVLKAILLNSST